LLSSASVFFYCFLIGQSGGILQPDLGRPILQRPVPRYFVMLDRLSGSQQPGIERWAVLIVFDDFFAFFENAYNGFTGFCLRPLSKNLKNLLKPNEKSFAARSTPANRPSYRSGLRPWRSKSSASGAA
jgi:hypothetical protein